MTLNDFITRSGQRQTTWASRLDISPGYLSGILSGKRLPSLELACKIEALTESRVPAGSWFLGEKAVSTQPLPSRVDQGVRP